MHSTPRPHRHEKSTIWTYVPLTLVTICTVVIVFSALSALNVPVSYYQQQVVAEYQAAALLVPLPERLVIPSLDIDAAVQYVGLTADGSGEMAVPSNFVDVGWYEYGVRPGMGGSAVIAGHVSGREIAEAVFYDLHTLVVGDEITIIRTDQVQVIFRVVKVKTYAYNAPTNEVFVSTDGKTRLNLITCSGTWLSDKNRFDTRTVVFTELVEES